ncbi:MAG: M67 family peptidase [Actinobacteria bacterium]|nr:M67 family peptidase [Actinomycetota bacterium]
MQHDARLDHVEDGVFVSGAPIARQHGIFSIFLRHVGELSLGSVGIVDSRSLVITTEIEQQIVAHARACKPQEMCGLLVGTASGDATTNADTDRALEFHPCRNAAASAIVYTLDPKDYMRVEQSADERGLAVLGVVHSHTHTEAYPSPTDVAQAPDPNWNYAIVSLKYDPPRLRNFRIVAGEISETAINITR